MKIFLTAAALSLGLATASMAADFDNAVGNLELHTGNVVLKLDTEENLRLGYHTLDHETAIGLANVYLELGVNLDTEETTVRAEYMIGQDNARFGYYLAPALEYRSDIDELVFDPYVGVTVGIGGNVVPYAELGYATVVGGDQLGAWAELGADVFLTENTTLTPALVHSFDVPNVADETQLSLTVSVAF